MVQNALGWVIVASGMLTLLADPITVGIASERDFCLMLPPQPGQNIGNTEGSSLARCMGTVPGSNSVGPMPQGTLLVSKG